MTAGDLPNALNEQVGRRIFQENAVYAGCDGVQQLGVADRSGEHDHMAGKALGS